MRYIVYIFWAVIITAVEYFLITEMIASSFLIRLLVINTIVLFVVEGGISKSIYRKHDWWNYDGGFFDQQITCKCEKCRNWRKSNSKVILRNRFAISLFLLFPTIAVFIGKGKLDFEKESKQNTVRIIDFEEQKIQLKVDSFFDSLKVKGAIPKSLNPEFKLSYADGGPVDTIIAEYSYTTNEKFEADVLDFCSGCYLWSESKSAANWLFSLEKVLNNFLLKNLENGERVHIQLMGYADGIPVKRYIPYKNEFGTFPKNLDGQLLTSYILNGEAKPVRLLNGDSIDNSEIAFLRAFSIKEYLDNYIVPLIKVEKSYAFYGFTEEDPNIYGGKYRKVKLILKIINIPELGTIQNLPKKFKLLETIGFILTLLIIPFLGKVVVYHYQAWRDSIRKENESLVDKRLFFVLIFMLIILIICIIVFVPSVRDMKVI